jgi:hypothetical protein
VFAVALAVPLAVRAAQAAGPRARRLGLALGPGALSLVVMAIAFWDWYGSPLPGAPYDPVVPVPAALGSRWELPVIYLNGISQMLSPEVGWLPTAPVAVLALAGVPLLWSRFGWWGVYGTLAACAYLLVSFTVNPGFAYPARYMVAIAPLAAIPLLVAVARLGVVKAAFVPLALLSLGLSVDAATHAGEWYPLERGYLDTPLAKRFHEIWPKVWPPTGDKYPRVAFAAMWASWIGLAGALMWTATRSRLPRLSDLVGPLRALRQRASRAPVGAP